MKKVAFASALATVFTVFVIVVTITRNGDQNSLTSLEFSGGTYTLYSIDADPRFTWFVRPLGFDDRNRISACGGSLIAPDLVLTAAHCDDPNRVMVGPYNLREILAGQEGTMVRRNVVEISRHPEWEDIPWTQVATMSKKEGRKGKLTIDNDVMLLKLETPVLSIAPVRLNFDDSFPSETGEPLTILGFGSTIGGPATAVGYDIGPNRQATILQEKPTNYVSFEDCAVATDPETGASYGLDSERTFVEDHWLCTLRNDTSACYGDSGGPVVHEGPSGDLLVGVISGASGYCGNPYLPAWNNRVSYHADWILGVGCELSAMPPAEWCCPGKACEPLPTQAPTELVSSTTTNMGTETSTTRESTNGSVDSDSMDPENPQLPGLSAAERKARKREERREKRREKKLDWVFI